MKRRALVVSSALLVAAAAAPSCGERAAGFGGGGGVRRDAAAADPIAFGELPELSLVASDGSPVTRDDLLGRPFALACIFTTCTGPCPAISVAMKGLQEELQGTDALLVSLSVDPEIDTPEVLAAYARSYEADPARWRFLTGTGEEIDRVVRGSFYLPLQRGRPSEDVPLGVHVTHSTELVVFDRRGRIRGYYSGKTRDGLARLAARLRHLDAEPTPPGAAGGGAESPGS